MGLGQGGGLATVPRAVGHICVTGWHEEERKSGWIDSSAGKHKDLSVISKSHVFKKAGYGGRHVFIAVLEEWEQEKPGFAGQPASSTGQ